MVKYSNRGLSNDPSNLWLFGVLYWILYLSLEVWTQSILLGKFFLVERDYLTFSKQAIRYFIDISAGLQVGRDEQIFDLVSKRTFMLQMNSYKCVDIQSDLCRHKQKGDGWTCHLNLNDRTLSFLRCKNSFNERDDVETFDDMKTLGIVASTIVTARNDVLTIVICQFSNNLGINYTVYLT